MDDFQQPSTSKCGQSNSSAEQAFELTAGAGDAGTPPCAETAGAMLTVPSQAHLENHQNSRKRKTEFSEAYEMPSCDITISAPSISELQPESVTRKRRVSPCATNSTYDDDGSDDTRSNRTLPDKKQNHSEIEKRRRDKMNTYISELSSMVPMCGAMARKLDKLTVLRMAVQYLRSVRGALSAGPLTVRPRPAFLSEQELNALVLHAARDCFLMVVGCDRGRLLYVSASVTTILHYDQSELLGQSLFDILHPKDVAKVKEQLSSSDLSPRERLIDAKTMLPVKADMVAGASRLCPGARRSFFCRIKCRNPANRQQPNQVKEEGETNDKMRKKQEKKYCVVQCTGYLKSWAPAEMSESGADGNPDDGDACNLSCLVAVGRALTDLTPHTPPAPFTRYVQYISRHATDGKFLFVDQRVTLALGFLPQELLGTSLYEYISAAELGAVARTHKSALLRRDALSTPPYCFRRKDGTYARIQTEFKPFRNPWTKDVECLVANNTLVTEEQEQPLLEDCNLFDIYKHSEPFWDQLHSALSETDVEMQRLIDSQIESHKIGSTIAEEALGRPPSDYSPELPGDILQDTVFNTQGSVGDNYLGVDMAYNNQVRNNVPLSSVGAEGSPIPDINGYSSTSSPPSISPPISTLGLDGNGEAAMAVIMSLLEADAGLGGPVNFSTIPWPLP
ncbi:protein cycle isoform X3 [Nymphalis io]|uniref:protein cycle isoform X3 n=1 Tax=Inachis io TaxID=171585 RepID=UPI002169EC6C|nr:protein cycle isoform X3 [Nymphalis io]